MENNPIHLLIQEDEITRLCQEFIRFDTTNPPGDERPMVEYIRDYLQPYGFETGLIEQGDKRATLVARLKGNGKKPAVVFNGHADVVPVGASQWQHPPFEGIIEEGKVWGRGSTDMKGGVAAMIVAAKALAQAHAPLEGDLIATVTTDEEVSMSGARELTQLPDAKNWQVVIIPEPTANNLGLAERGVFWPEFTTYGKTAHGSTPELGINAVMMMVHLLTELDKLPIPFQLHPILGNFTRSINTIQGGVKVNVVPDQCTALVDMRTVPGQDHQEILNLLKDFLAKLTKNVPDFNSNIRITFELPPVETSFQEPVVQQFINAARLVVNKDVPVVKIPFATEAAILVPALKVPTLIFGPGEPTLAHQPNEYIEISKMVEAAQIYAAAALAYLKG